MLRKCPSDLNSWLPPRQGAVLDSLDLTLATPHSPTHPARSRSRPQPGTWRWPSRSPAREGRRRPCLRVSWAGTQRQHGGACAFRCTMEPASLQQGGAHLVIGHTSNEGLLSCKTNSRPPRRVRGEGSHAREAIAPCSMRLGWHDQHPVRRAAAPLRAMPPVTIPDH